MKPFFSVIVPIYNTEKYLKDCVDSILTQSFSNFELILVDDGSTDNCGKICDEYAKNDSRICVIHKENGGHTSARKAGLNIANGEYIAMIDSDDYISGDYLKCFNDIIEKHNPDIVCCGMNIIINNRIIEKKINFEYKYYNKDLIKKEIFPVLIESSKCEYFPPSQWAKAIKKDLYIKSQNCVNDNIKIGEDRICTIVNVHNANSIVIDKKCNYYYRRSGNSMTLKKVFDWNDAYLIASSIENIICNNKYDFNEQLNRLVTHHLYLIAESRFNSKDKLLDIFSNINDNLNFGYYKTAINKSQFSCLRGNFSKFVLKYKIYPLIFLSNFWRH